VELGVEVDWDDRRTADLVSERGEGYSRSEGRAGLDIRFSSGLSVASRSSCAWPNGEMAVPEDVRSDCTGVVDTALPLTNEGRLEGDLVPGRVVPGRKSRLDVPGPRSREAIEPLFVETDCSRSTFDSVGVDTARVIPDAGVDSLSLVCGKSDSTPGGIPPTTPSRVIEACALNKLPTDSTELCCTTGVMICDSTSDLEIGTLSANSLSPSQPPGRNSLATGYASLTT
jgi:hypothetical protein